MKERIFDLPLANYRVLGDEWGFVEEIKNQYKNLRRQHDSGNLITTGSYNQASFSIRCSIEERIKNLQVNTKVYEASGLSSKN